MPDKISDTDSVFQLLTQLCEIHSKDRKVVRRLRSRCYEAFLGKTQVPDPRKYHDLQGVSSSNTCILSWCFRLSHEFDQREASQKIVKCLDDFKSSYTGDKKSQNSILRFLYLLRDLPPENEDKLDLSVLPKIEDKMSKFQTLFRLPPALLLEFENSKDSLHSLEITLKTSRLKLFNSEFTLKLVPKSHSSLTSLEFESQIGKQSFSKIRRSKSDFCADVNVVDRLPEAQVTENKFLLERDKIWEAATERKDTGRRNWENYGYAVPRNEAPFLTELGELTSLWVENLESLYLRDNFTDFGTIPNIKIRPRKEVLKDLKFLLIGMSSSTFPVNAHNVFFLMPGVMVETLAPDTLESFCESFLFCGACCRGLWLMSSQDSDTRKYIHPGYVFAEFCVSLNRYLQFYRAAIMSIPYSTNFLEFEEKTYQLRRQISTLASICKVGPFTSETEELPHGVALLNYLYHSQQVLGLSDTNLSMVLYSILYPCCQIYFSQFLHQWIFKGSINDPYGEFFVTVNSKYINTRGRTFWNRSYQIRQDIVPDFLVDLKDEILYCGKMMNLLEMCVAHNKLCLYLKGKIPVMLTCCLTSEKLSDLERNASRYFLDASAECGSKFDLSETLRRDKFQDAGLINLMAKKRAATLRRIELEREKSLQEHREKKYEELQILREQYEAAMEQKALEVYRGIRKEITNIEESLRIEEIRDRLVAEEAQKIISYYSELSNIVDNRKKKVEQYLSIVKNLNIDTNIEKEHATSKDNFIEKPNSSTESFYSVLDDEENENPSTSTEDLNKINTESNTEEDGDILKPIRSSQSLDLINANTEHKAPEKLDNINENINLEKTQTNLNIQQAINNFETAKRNKIKVLNQDFNIITGIIEKGSNPATILENLTEAQKNKLKVLNQDLNSFTATSNKDDNQTQIVNNLTEAQKNKLKVLNQDFDIFSGTSNKVDYQTQIVNNLTEAQKNKLKVLSQDFNIFTGESTTFTLNKHQTKPLTELTEAQKNKLKVLSQDFDIFSREPQKNEPVNSQSKVNTTLTAAQRNKLKVLSSEFGIDVINKNVKVDNVLTIAQINRNRNLTANECFSGNFTEKRLDNEKFLSKMDADNFKIPQEMKKSKSLTLNLQPSSKTFDKVVPMSVDSTPLSEFTQCTTPLSEVPASVTPSTHLSVETRFDSLPSTSTSTAASDVGNLFYFGEKNQNNLRSQPQGPILIFSKRVTLEEASGITKTCPNLFLNESVSIPLLTQKKLVSNELLRYFVEELGYLKHLRSLRDYFFLQDGEFGRNITENLFKNLYRSNFPLDLINCRTLHSLGDIPTVSSLLAILSVTEVGKKLLRHVFVHIELDGDQNLVFKADFLNFYKRTKDWNAKDHETLVLRNFVNKTSWLALNDVFNAIDISSKHQENSQFLSFKINSLPKCFDLGNPDVLDCLSLTYKVKWPLNILLPSETISKYDQVFKYLVKLNRISWVLKQIFLELKVLAKETGKKEIYLMSSPQYRRLHQCRHVMHHFIQTLQNYIVGEVLQPTWEIFEKNICDATTLDDLYAAHTVYIKDILNRCHLSQKSLSLRKIIQKIFTVILKFYDYLRSRSWMCEDGQFTHPNFSKLDKIFKNFEEIVIYLIKVIKKYARKGYQPHLVQFLDILDVNSYFSKQILKSTSLTETSQH